jgi:hypothetical protein
METSESRSEVNREFFSFNTGEAYERYFNLLASVGRKLILAYGVTDSDGKELLEAKVVQTFIEKFLYTVSALNIKFTYSPAHNRQLWIDLSESGFPNHAEITKLDTDLVTKDSQLMDIPNASLLRLKFLDHLFQTLDESKDLLWQMAEREYLEMLDSNQLFTAFTPGELVRFQDNRKGRSYVYSWGCYDFETNRPYIHVMAFEQDLDREPLESDSTQLRHFHKVVRAEGSRVPQLSILGIVIDEALDWVHPKVIKRFCVGPLYSPLLLNGEPGEQEQEACQLLRRFSRSMNDFMLFYETEIVFSEKQKETRSMFAPKKVREIFHIPVTDNEAFKRRASIVQKSIMMPHVVLQHMSRQDKELLGIHGGVKVLTYDEKGDVHGA